MALTELQRPDGILFKNNMQRIADEMYRHFSSWECANDFLSDVETSDLTTMGITDTESINILSDLRQAVGDMVSLFNGNAVTPTKNPKEVIDKIRRMMPI